MAEETNTKKEGEDKVEVSATVLKDLLDKIATLEQRTKEFEQTAPEDQIRKLDALRATGKLIKSVKVRRLDGELVIGWKIVKDEVWVADGKLHELQELEIYFQNGKKKNMPLLQFSRNVLYESYEVIKEAKTQTGELEFTFMLSDGKEVTINSKYVN